jgi:hypothetical protein
MYLLLISKGLYTIYTTSKERDQCELLEFFESLGPNLQKDRNHMLALFERVALEGVPRNIEISHQIKGKLFEFIQGRLRVFWFYDEGRLIICTSGLVKKGRKTPKNEIDHAMMIMNKYFEDKKQGELRVIKDEVFR